MFSERGLQRLKLRLKIGYWLRNSQIVVAGLVPAHGNKIIKQQKGKIMENMEVKKIVAKLLSDKVTLSEIQNILKSEHKHSITFLDLRLLASELDNIDWNQFDPKKEKEEKTEEKTDPVPQQGDGSTHIEMNKIQRIGAMASGSVIFASGASADWIVDQAGRLGFEKQNGEPTKEDMEDFQTQLQQAIAGGL